MKELHFKILSQFYEFSSMTSYLDCSFCGVWLEVGERGCPRSFLCFASSTVSLQSSVPLQKKLSCPSQSVAAEIIELHMVSGSTKGHRHQHGPQIGRLQVAAQARDTHMVFGGNTDHSKSLTPVWSLVATQATDISIPPPQPPSSIDYEHQRDLQQ